MRRHLENPISAVLAAFLLSSACGRTPLDDIRPGQSDGASQNRSDGDGDDRGPQSSGPGMSAVAGSMLLARFGHTATLLPNGQVLIAGGSGASDGLSSVSALARAELYDPKSGSFRETGTMVVARTAHTATLLLTGKVLIVGGMGGSDLPSRAEIYDPDSGQFTATGTMTAQRYEHKATLLPNGQVLITGGFSQKENYQIPPQAELYDPASGQSTTTGAMLHACADHTATLLRNGRVLITGGRNSIYYSRAELYDPAGGAFGDTGKMAYERWDHTATVLPSGKVLVTGGWGIGSGRIYNFLSSAETYDPGSGTFTEVGAMNTGRGGHTETLLPSGKVLVIGGWGGELNDQVLSGTEIYDPDSGSFAVTGSMAVARVAHTATLLPNGKVLIVGGRGRDSTEPFSSSELYY